VEDRIKSKRVGKVNICEVFGNFCDGFARRGKVAIDQLSKSQAQTPDLLLNVTELENIDSFGIGVLTENAIQFRKRGLFLGQSKLTEQFSSERIRSVYQILKSRSEVASYFASEFAVHSSEVGVAEECRGFVRLKTVIPAQFFFRDDQEKQQTYFAVVTNLSEGGLYAEFIDSDTEVHAVKVLDPIELKLIEVRMALTPGLKVSGEAKVVHAKRGEGGIGMEFYRLPEDDRSKLVEWLTSQYSNNALDPKNFTGEVQESQGGNSK